jgi:hypothetical protein
MLVTCVLRVRDCEPPPHVCEQAPQEDHVDWTQWIGHATSLQEAVSESAAQPTPPFDTGVTTVRLRDMVPSPHDTVHDDHCCQLETTQSTGHASVLHDTVSWSSGQEKPPWSLWVTTERERLFVPLPQDLVQAEYAEKALRTQCTGHGPSVHTCISLRLPQMRPPWAAGVVTVRVRDCVPEPHVTEQLPHESHSVVSQSTAQAWVLHAMVSLMAGHTTPPKAGATSWVRVRPDEPEPHDALHADHAVKPEVWQSIGHAERLQWRTSFSCGHSWPPEASSRVTERTRTCVPPPQEKEHASHEPHEETRQSTGHAKALQASVAETVGQARPPAVGIVMIERLRVRTPMAPHECVHGDQLPQSATTQFCGQGMVLHTREALVCSQAWPPCAAAVEITKIRDCWPVPHDCEQAPHVPHAPTQSTGQAFVLQSCDCVSCGHPVPPATAAWRMLRVRY